MTDGAAAGQGARGLPLTLRLLRTQVRRTLAGLGTGRLRVRDGSGETTFGSGGGLVATITVNDPEFYRAVALDGAMGAAEAYMAGEFECDDLTALVRLFIQNRAVLDGMDRGLAAPKRLARDALRIAARNTRRGSRRNIAAHYDLGNELFELFLDDNLMYSSAVYPRAEASLEEAAHYKNDLICRKLALSPSDHVLEIGTGWGGFALQAARDYGCRITTTTVSRAQHDLAAERIERAGLADRITLLLCDYRDLTGRFDKLVSIEMLEAVGANYYDTYFAQCSKLLADDGLMCVQTITMNEQHYERARDHVDFIKKYIFPGGCLPSLGAICAALARAGDLNVAHVTDIGAHYARTLRDWRARFEARIDRVRALGYDDAFVRRWRYYLHYCEAGFVERTIGNLQLLLYKPGNRLAPPLM